MNDIIEMYLESLRLERGASANSVEAYNRDLNRFSKHFNGKSLDTLTSMDITDYLIYLQNQNLSTSTIARSLSAIKGLLKYALRSNLVKSNPAETISGPQIARPLPETLTVQQVMAILKLPDRKTKLGLRDRALLEFLYGTGARISEALNCREDDLMPEMMLVRLFGKGRKERVVPLGSAGWKALDDYRQKSRPEMANSKSADYIFKSRRKK